MTTRFSIPRPNGPALGLLTLFVLFAGILAYRGQLGNFLSLHNFQTLLHDFATVPGIVALGMLLVIISGGIDLSVGSVVALVTVVAMQTYRGLLPSVDPLSASLAAVVAGLTTGALAGLVNGLTVTRLGLPPFVATLGMMSIARGLAYWASGRRTLAFPSEPPGWIVALSTGNVSAGLVDLGVWSLLGLALLTAAVLHQTVFGRYAYAIGASEPAARRAGVDVERQKIYVYVAAGLFTGWAGLVAFAHTRSGDPNLHQSLVLDVIAAVVIGGASLNGGVGTVTGTLLGVLILAMLENGMIFLNQAVEVKYVLIGAIVIVNTALSQWQQSRQR